MSNTRLPFQLSLFREEAGESGRLEGMLGKEVSIKKLAGANSDSSDAYWERIARVALTRFPELDRGEKISYKEIKKTLNLITKYDYLKKIEETGVPVSSYVTMKRHEMFNLLIHKIRPFVWRQAWKWCPVVADEIKRENYESKIAR